MVSAAKIRANRANAKVSTGPKTLEGRARSAQNALRHGLSMSIRSNKALADEVEELTREIAGPRATPEINELARQVAEAQIDLLRIRDARHQLLSDCMSNPYYERKADTRKKLKVIGQILGRKALFSSMEELEAYLLSTPQGPQKLATILQEESKAIVGLGSIRKKSLVAT